MPSKARETNVAEKVVVQAASVEACGCCSSLFRLRKVAPTGPFTLRHRSSRCSMPRSQNSSQCWKVEDFYKLAMLSSLASRVRGYESYFFVPPQDRRNERECGQVLIPQPERKEGPACRQRAESRRGWTLQVPPLHVGDTRDFISKHGSWMQATLVDFLGRRTRSSR